MDIWNNFNIWIHNLCLKCFEIPFPPLTETAEIEGKVTSTIEGEFRIEADTIIVIPFDRKIEHKKILITYSENGKKRLTDLTTNVTYR